MKNLLRKFLVIFFLAVSLAPLAISKPAHAGDNFSDDNAMTRSMCNVMIFVTGGAGKTFAAFAIIAVGVGFFSGKISWATMIATAMGIAAIFGAPTIVAAITGSKFTCSEDLSIDKTTDIIG